MIEVSVKAGESWQRRDASQLVDVLVASDMYIEIIDRDGYISHAASRIFRRIFARECSLSGKGKDHE